MVQSGDIETALKKLIQAEKADINCPRTSLMQAQLAIRDRAFPKAINYLQRIEKQDVSFLPEVLDIMVQCYRELGKEAELTTYLIHLTSLNLGTGPIIVLCEQLGRMGKTVEARDRLLAELKRKPNLRGIDLLLGILAPADLKEGAQILSQVKDFTGLILAEQFDYVCENCGFQARVLHWQCPSCKFWNSVKPV